VKLPDIPEDQLGRSLQSQNNGNDNQVHGTLEQAQNKKHPQEERKKVNNFTSYGKDIDKADLDIIDITEQAHNSHSPVKIGSKQNETSGKFGGKHSINIDGSMNED